ncbi:MAG: hydrogenase maturation nickel metallochaperone HypA [Candidatus Brocadiales bacterium]
MHDIESCKAILDAVDKETKKRSGKRVVRIKLSVGSLSGTNPDHLRETLILCSTGTVAEGAELELTKKPATIGCLECGHEFETDGPGFPGCRKCESPRTRIIDGDGVTLESLEIETD